MAWNVEPLFTRVPIPREKHLSGSRLPEINHLKIKSNFYVDEIQRWHS